MNPYKIEGPALIGFSGGRTSAYMLHRILDANGGIPANVHVCFQNTGKERWQTLDFVAAVQRQWGVPIDWIEWDGFVPPGRSKCIIKPVTYETASRKGEPFEKLNRALGVLPNPVMRTCTANLKIKASQTYMQTLGYKTWDAVMGIRADEPKRVARMNAPGRDNRAGDPYLPLAIAGVTKRDVIEFWRKQPFDLALDPQSDMGNCDLCYLKSSRKVVAQIKAEPALADWWADQEGATGLPFRRDRPDYHELKRIAIYSQRQVELFNEVDLVDCICGD